MIITNSLHVLCFGNSITAGYTQGGRGFHPYAIALQEALEQAWPSWNISTDVQGLPGDQVISPPGAFLPRMDTLYEEVHPVHPYDWVIILGGTNDLNQNRVSREIFPALEKVWDIPLSGNTKVLALTITDCGFCAPQIGARRADLNRRILKHEADNFYTYDLFRAISFWDMPEKRRRDIWDDGLHFTAEGYDLMGKLLAARLIELIEEEERLEPEKGELK
ncbi:GDSL-like Lipase/Acylhydrolase [Drepanopeziza brunnea f. sp. 'multigermtubi' MB_m1]|uniref:GDSL-like Lipase/Acylhydrolase n=1 Tax=Marssonina brunnea f. sp. multigermtubi (strain MB_m1) TaxID=1072389 RepID=K1Y1R1_MARBU|nr:GDSL-like Lipase/Acylhydrolase [Drepanopeziza brunnea f. sp. 'multigermtubi' MB_m1]EKD19074.1 GDSL-like Lipase/Acylhydrolase [Drepanopeziza brunnea f. sp. 'multigermtubi' MB_m1]